MGKGHRLCLTFDEHERNNPTLALPTREGSLSIDDCVGTKEPTPIPSLKGRETECHFYSDERSGIVQLLHQMVKQLLPDPLFGRKSHPTVTPFAEDLLLILVYAGAHKDRGLVF